MNIGRYIFAQVVDFLPRYQFDKAVKSSLPAEEVVAMENNEEMVRRARRPNLDFHLLGINDGERLYWKDDQTMFVTVCSERKVWFNGKQCYLTTATKEILGTTAPTAPAPYWLHNGKFLKDIYDSFYEPTDGTDSTDETEGECDE